MGPVVKSFSQLVLLLRDESLELPHVESGAGGVADLQNRSVTVALGEHAAIKMSPGKNGDIHVRVTKHGRVEDLFPADYLVEKGGSIRVQHQFQNHDNHRNSVAGSTSSGAGKYDFEVHVDAKHVSLLRVIDWEESNLSSRSSATTLQNENEGGAVKESVPALRTAIFVKSDNGENRLYTNERVELKVLDFDVVDENGDGIFEPGDLIRVENIKVQNLSSSPSPVIPLSIAPTKWIQPVNDGLRLSPIPGSSVVRIEGGLQGYIQQDVRRDLSLNLRVVDVIRLVARLPDLGMEPSAISIEKKLVIRFPLYVEMINYPSWIAPGSTSEISWKITNISRIPVQRAFAAALSIRDSKNTVSFTESPNSQRLINQFQSLEPNNSITITKSIHSVDLEGCSTPSIRLDVLLAEPQDDRVYFSPLPSLHPPLRLISVLEKPLTIAKPLRYTMADILLVPNSETPDSTILEWTQFISNIGSTMDIYNLGLYRTFDPKGRDVLGMYRGKTIVFLGNEFSTGEFGRSSVTDAIDVAEISKLAAQGTSIFVCDVEMPRSRDMRLWLGDVIHRTSNIPGAHMFMEPDDVVDCLRQKRDDTRYITSAKVGLTWEKSADKFQRVLLKQLPSRRFLISKHDETRICVRESLDLNCRVAVHFSHGSTGTAACQYTFISILPFSTRLSLLWSFFTKTHPYAKIAEYLSISIANDLLSEQRIGGTSLLEEFLSYNPCQFNANSVYFVAVILSALSYGRGVRKKSSKEDIQQFAETHYSSDLRMVLASRLRWQRRLSMKDMQGKISAACGIDVNEYNSRISTSSEIGSEIRESVTRRKGKTDDARIQFETMYADCLDELLEFIPVSLTRNSSATLLPEQELTLQNFLQTDPFKNW